MESAHNVFLYDETPTPTRFIRNCEEVGLFQDLQHVNPFEETFRTAVQSSNNDLPNLLRNPLKLTMCEDTLDTPRVIPSSKSTNHFDDVYPITEDDEDVIILPNNYLIESILPDNYHDQNVLNDNDSDKSSDTEVIDPLEHNYIAEYMPACSTSHANHNRESDSTLNDHENILYAIEDDSLKNHSISGFYENNSVKTNMIPNDPITNEFLVSQKFIKTVKKPDKILMSENANILKTSDISRTSDFLHHVPISTVLNRKNVVILPSKNSVKDTAQCNIFPKQKQSVPSNETVDSNIKQKLKNLLKTSNRVILETPQEEEYSLASNETNGASCVDDEKREYSRQRNRMAQKRCRMKKKKWIMQLKKETDSVFSSNQNLQAEVTTLRAEIAHLKTLLLAHKNCSVTRAMFKTDISSIMNDDSSKLSNDIMVPAVDDDDDDETQLTSEKQNGNVFNNHVHHHHRQILQNPQIHVHVPFDLKSKKPYDNQQNFISQLINRPTKTIDPEINLKRKLIFDSKVVPIKLSDKLSKDSTQQKRVPVSQFKNDANAPNANKTGVCTSLNKKPALKVFIANNSRFNGDLKPLPKIIPLSSIHADIATAATTGVTKSPPVATKVIKLNPNVKSELEKNKS